MKEKETSKLYNSITNVDSRFIEEAQIKVKKKMPVRVKWGIIAACLCLVFVSVFAGPKLFSSSVYYGSPLMVYGNSQQLAVTPVKNASGGEMTEEQAEVLNEFAFKLFQKSFAERDNTLISPISVLYALSMTEGGAKGETLNQMETLLGMPMEELRDCLHSYQTMLDENWGDTLYLANSIWFKDDENFEVKQSFLDDHAGYYDAELFKTAFSEETVNDINAWIKEKTNGKISRIIDHIPEKVVMYLINTLSFDAEWDTVYEGGNIKRGVFTTEDGEEQLAYFMRHIEEDGYLNDDLATGFMKNYAGNKYAFLAMLPHEGVSMEEYVASMSGKWLSDLLNTAQMDVAVSAAIPKFSAEFDIEMNDVLIDLGVVDAFDENLADFSGISESESNNLYINRVLHKTTIEVDGRGTKAGAATVVENAMTTGIEPGWKEPVASISLDRPFVYLIIDLETNLPLFIGTTLSIK